MPAHHPDAPVPDRLFVDEERERRWRARFTAARMSRPGWARDAPDRSLYTSNASGTTEVYAWDRATDLHRQVTDRASGTYAATLPPDGETVWWFADTDGDEFGHWVAEPFGGRPAGESAEPAVPGVEDGYSAGLDIGRAVVAAGTSTDDGTRIWVRRGGTDPAGPAEVIYAHREDAGVGALSEDETLLAISHSEHGDSRHPAVRVLRVADGVAVAEKSDGPGKALSPIAFAPVPGDGRLLLVHERRGREELLIWDVPADTETELALDLPGEVMADFSPDASFLLVWHTHAARTRLHRYDLAAGVLTELPVAPGCVGSADVRPDGTVEYTCSSAAEPSTVRALHPDGTDRVLVTPPGERAPGSVSVDDLWVGEIHALVARPAGVEAPAPTVFSLHGGPHAADEDRFSAVRALWVDAGFVVVEVNYRGSTGYGSPWRDAIEGRPGTTELEDVAAVYDHCVAEGIADPVRCVVEGWSWGGYLALLAAGTQPQRWAAVIAGVPVADYLAAYEDEMEQLRAFDRALFGGSPEEKPDAYRAASPITYVDAVRAPVLVLAGENDPRCPIRQIDNYLDALAARGDVTYEVSRFDAGHGSLVVEQSMRHFATEVDFALRACQTVAFSSTSTLPRVARE
jgi:dipeptidyl aminopeptidase/acylaminoacyl peptidase